MPSRLTTLILAIVALLAVGVFAEPAAAHVHRTQGNASVAAPAVGTVAERVAAVVVASVATAAADHGCTGGCAVSAGTDHGGDGCGCAAHCMALALPEEASSPLAPERAGLESSPADTWATRDPSPITPPPRPRI